MLFRPAKSPLGFTIKSSVDKRIDSIGRLDGWTIGRQRLGSGYDGMGGVLGGLVGIHGMSLAMISPLPRPFSLHCSAGGQYWGKGVITGPTPGQGGPLFPDGTRWFGDLDLITLSVMKLSAT